MLFTQNVLTGTVVAIYAVFPTRHAELLDEAIAHHRTPGATWDLTTPSQAELRAWWYGIVGKDAPLPRGVIRVSGARRIEVMDRDAALMRLRIGSEDVTYLVQRARSVAPRR